MLISKKIISLNQGLIRLIKISKIPNQVQNISAKNPAWHDMLKVPKFGFAQNQNTVPTDDRTKKYENFDQIRKKIENMTLELSETEQIKELEKIIYPEALLDGQEDVCKLTKLYDTMVQYIQKENLEHKLFEDLIKAGRHYQKMHVRRLRALRPYLKAKHQMESQNLHTKNHTKPMYENLCERINYLIKQDIQNGQLSNFQHYYNQGLKNQKQGNQLQALYYYYKGICISEYQKIPDRLIHFDMVARYTYLSQLIRPKAHHTGQCQQCKESIQRYDKLQDMGNKWWKEEFQKEKDPERRQKFRRIMSWVLSNKGDVYYRWKMYDCARICYQKVIQIYKLPENQDIKLKIVKVIDHLEKCYEHLGMNSKAMNFLEWAHDFVKSIVSQNSILKTRYLKPIDEMMISFYQKLLKNEEHEIQTKKRNIEQELREIVQ